MNDRLSAFIAGFGTAGLLLLGARVVGPVTEGVVLTLFAMFGLAAVAIGVMDWWFDRRQE